MPFDGDDHVGSENLHEAPENDGKRFKRTYVACLNCRVRKVKCDLGSEHAPRDRCVRCARERRDCVFVDSKKRKLAKVRPGPSEVAANRTRTASPLSANPSGPGDPPGLGSSTLSGGSSAMRNSSVSGSSTTRPINAVEKERDLDTAPKHFSTMEGALVFLANAAGKIASADERDHIDAREKHSELESRHGSGSGPVRGQSFSISHHSIRPSIETGRIPGFSGVSRTLEGPEGLSPRGLGPEGYGSSLRRDNHAISNDSGGLKSLGNFGDSNARTELNTRHGSFAATGLSPNTTHDAPKSIHGFIHRSAQEKFGHERPGHERSESDAGLQPNTDSRSSLESSAAATPTSDEKPPAFLRAHIPAMFSRPPSNNDRLMMPPAEHQYSARPESSNVLSEIEYIGDSGILTAAEAEHLIDMFFSTMHPFFPHIPKFLHSPRALSGYPILLCAILTISSRYHSLASSGAAGVAKNIEIHDRLWLYVQRLISQTVWAEASTRSIGTVFAFLLFTEWNPRAIHWRWSDYANRAEDVAVSRERETGPDSVSNMDGVNRMNGANGGSGMSGLNGINTVNGMNGMSGMSNSASDPISATSEPAGLGAMRRSYRMAWMLIGSAVRLAQDTGFMELSAKTYLATHVAEINSVMNMKRRSMLSHSLAELDMDTAEISEAEMEAREDNEIKVLGLSEDMNFPENTLQFTEAQKAQIELLQITSVGHESLYGYKAQLGSLSQRQNLSILNFMHPMISSWSRKYKKFLVPSKSKLARKVSVETLRGSGSKVAQGLAAGIENESFIFEFNYTKLYIYSLALSPSPKAKEGTKNGKVSLKLDEISKSAKYIEQAFNAANEILQVAHRVHKLKMLRFMPVRWVTRIVRAVAFMVKCYLTITAHKTAEISTDPSSNIDHFDATILSLSLISVEEIVQSIQKAAITLRDCSPDELHLCTRYSNVLLYLYSEMKATLKNYSAVGDDVEDTAERETQQQTSAGAPTEPEPEPVASTAASATESTNYAESFREFPDAGFTGDSEVIDWFINNRNVGLDFVGPWTELIEQQIEGQNLNMDSQLNFG